MWFGSFPPHDRYRHKLATPIKRAVYFLLGWPNFLRRLQWPTFKRFLDIRPGLTVLDIGAGPMQYAVELAKERTLHVTALDIAFPGEAAEWAKDRGITLLCSTGESIPRPDQSIDRILLSSVLQMVPRPDLLLNECHRILKPDGYLVMSVPNPYRFIAKLFSEKSYRHFIEHLNKRFGVQGPSGYYTYDQVSALLSKSGFQIDTHAYSPGFVGSLLWEMGVVCYAKLGGAVFMGLFLFYPIAKLCDFVWPASLGSEHLLKASPQEKKPQ